MNRKEHGDGLVDPFTLRGGPARLSDVPLKVRGLLKLSVIMPKFEGPRHHNNPSVSYIEGAVTIL